MLGASSRTASSNLSEYELKRLETVKRNREILAKLGVSQPTIAPRVALPASPKKKAAKAKKVVKPVIETNSDDGGSVASEGGGPRRSRRVSKQPTRFEPLAFPDDDPTSGSDNGSSRLTKRKHAARPKKDFFGELPAYPVGHWFESRNEACHAGVHRRTVHGIAGSKVEGAYSIVLSGGYEDDVDLGDAFTYTGSGGRDLKGTKANPKNLRTAAQSSDQKWAGDNLAMKISFEKGHPIRVMRGSFKPSNKGGTKEKSPFAPNKGYRYDGLYKIESCWMEKGLSGFQVCKFALKRLPNQLPLINVSGEAAPDAEEAEMEDE